MKELKNSSEGKITWSKSKDGLRLGVATSNGKVELHLQNVGDSPLEVLSHVRASGIHLDWYKLQLENETAEKRTLTLSEDRDRSAIIKAHLEPGASIQHTVDVNAWASRPVNGARTLAAGTYRLTVTYTVPPQEGVWCERLEVGPVPFSVI